MQISTINVASVRARLPVLERWLIENPVDVLAIQETKVEDEKFPRDAFENLGYHVALNGQKAWNGVALLSKAEPLDIQRGFGHPDMPEDARIIAATIDGIRVVNTYVPNGNAVGNEKWLYKMKWLETFQSFIAEQSANKDTIWLGDINIAPQPHDVFDSPKLLGSVGHHPDEFSRLTNILSVGLIDLFRIHNFEPGQYTFWDFVIPGAVARGLGWRIDHIYATESLAEKCSSCVIDKEPRLWERPSDHTFVTATFDL
ncbi:MAG TPA: exodeoxyribonuclease III [Fimbriimonas sp.]|nr:exodeoxyribonuclease III [Fimbriimonas sp.]